MYIFSRAILPFTCSRSSVGFLQRRKWQKAPEAASGEGSRAPPSDAAGPLRPASTISSVPAAARLTPPSQLYLGPGRSSTRHPSSVQGSEIPLSDASAALSQRNSFIRTGLLVAGMVRYCPHSCIFVFFLVLHCAAGQLDSFFSDHTLASPHLQHLHF